ncbi:MAG: hypothetical protein WCJ64_23680 [Rhodospirillaceae bacterium]
MKDGLLERIQSVGHWRVNLRPLVPLEQQLSFQQCSDLVYNNKVSIRGWDYPHIDHRQDSEGGSQRGDNFYEAWCDWWDQHEFWRMYKSGQFLSYNALPEGSPKRNNSQLRGTLNILEAIYTITEFVEFAHRLHIAQLYRDGVIIRIDLRKTAGRYLEVGPTRMPFFDRKETGAETINLERTLELPQIRDEHQAIAVGFLLELFDYFGWNPSREQIATDQANFYRREFR